MLNIVGRLVSTALLIALGLALLPFLLLAEFNHPSGDNFCYAVSFLDPDFDGLLDVVGDWYRRWNARYFSVFLIGSYFTFFDMLSTYRWVPISLFLAWWLSVYLLFRTIFPAPQSRGALAAGALLLLVAYTLGMPKVSNGFYHVTGAFQYQTGNILTLLVLACLLRIRSSKPHAMAYAIAAGFLTFAVVGSTEMHMALMVSLVTGITIYLWFTGRPQRWYWLILWVVTVLSAVLMIVAPGNENRGSHFPNRHQFGFSVSQSLYQSGLWLTEWMKDPLLWVASVFLTTPLTKITCRSDLFRFTRWYHLAAVLIYCMMLVVGCFFIGFWAMGKPLPPRAINVVYFIFLLGWFLALGMASRLYLRGQINSLTQYLPASFGQVFTMAVALVLMVVVFNNHQFERAYADLTIKAVPYHQAFIDRYAKIEVARAQSLDLLEVPHIQRKIKPRTIMVTDIRTDSMDFRNDCYAEYFGIGAIKTY